MLRVAILPRFNKKYFNRPRHEDQMFSPGQAYIALSRFQSWNDIQILSLTIESFLTDQQVINKYKRLEQIASTLLSI